MLDEQIKSLQPGAVWEFAGTHLPGLGQPLSLLTTGVEADKAKAAPCSSSFAIWTPGKAVQWEA